MHRLLPLALVLLAATRARADEPVQVNVRGKAPARSASESVKDQKVIRAAPHRTGSDALTVLPGMWVSQHSGEGKAHQIFLRGYDAVHGQDVEFWVGGAPVNEVSNVHGQGYADLHFVPPELIRSLTLQPGSYDPRQGDFAVAGTVRYRLGMEQHGVLAKTNLGSFGSRRLFVGWHPAETSADTFAAFETYHTDGFGPSRQATRNSGMASYGLTLGSQTSLRFLVTGYNARYDSAGVVLRRDVEGAARGGASQGIERATRESFVSPVTGASFDPFSTYDSKQGGDSTRLSLVTELVRTTDDATMTLAPYVVVRDLRLRSNFTGYLLDPLAGDNTEQRNGATTFGGTASYARRMRILSAADRVEVGLQLRHDRIEQSQRRLAQVDDAVTRTEVDAKILASDLAAYADVRLKPWSRLELRGGARVDGLFYAAEDRQNGPSAVRSTAGAIASPRITADVRLTQGLHALASYGEGFRSPQARSLAPNQSLPYTRVRSAELGVRFDERPLAGSLAAFSSWLSKDLVFDQVTARNEPVPGTRRTGIAADVMVSLTDFLVLSGSATYTHAVFRQSSADAATASSTPVQAGDLLPYAPQLVARTDLSVERNVARIAGHPLEVHAGSGLTLLARRPLPYSEMGRDIFLWDARIEATYRNVTLGFDAMNLLDTRFYDGEFVFASRFDRGAGQSLVPQRHVTVGPPRALYATLALRI